MYPTGVYLAALLIIEGTLIPPSRIPCLNPEGGALTDAGGPPVFFCSFYIHKI